MDKLKQMMVFYHVVDQGSFTQASAKLKIAKSAVSRHISLLEKAMGARLLNRTTRQLGLTEVGRIYFKSCQRIFEETQFMQNEISVLQNQPVGLLKIAATNSIGNKYIVPLIAEFIRLYPKLDIELLVQDQVVDMVEEGVDVSIRVGWLQDSNFVAQKIADSKLILAASPDYLQKSDLISSPIDLLSHEWIIFSLLPNPYQWVFKNKKKVETVTIKGKLQTNNADAVRALLMQGVGMSVLSRLTIEDELKKGSLVEILPEYEIGTAGIYLVYQAIKFKQLKLQLFIDFINQKIQLS